MFEQISERALVARINRVLSREYRQLMKSRIGTQTFYSLGHFYILDRYHNSLIDHNVDVNELASDLGINARMVSEV